MENALNGTRKTKLNKTTRYRVDIHFKNIFQNDAIKKNEIFRTRRRNCGI